MCLVGSSEKFNTKWDDVLIHCSEICTLFFYFLGVGVRVGGLGGNAIIFAHFSFSTQVCGKIYMRENVYEKGIYRRCRRL